MRFQDVSVSIMSWIKDALLAILSRVRGNVLSVHDVGIVFYK